MTARVAIDIIADKLIKLHDKILFIRIWKRFTANKLVYIHIGQTLK